MAKTSDWKIVATEGSTIDGRKLLRQWFKEMAEQYSPQEYTAMIWPEHYRFGGFGNNWGTVEAVKAEEFDGKMRLFAKITPNQYLLAANKLGQKLFTSIEIEPDYKGEGRCYLKGLAVTDSPASTGTSKLEFSARNGKVKSIESDHLEELDFSECKPNALIQAIGTLFNHFQSGASSPEQTPETEQEDTEVTDAELKAALKETFSTLKTELSQEIETKFSALKLQPQEPETPEEQDPMKLFSAELTKQLKPLGDLTEKFNGLDKKFGELEAQFNALSGETGGQRPPEDGAGDQTVEAL
ncbi:GPO family capsid scaffolding protein [Vibrio metschnikovii]|uniref:GPO family capsid scaffolding protein n=1 Tax=Vibrio metschnikovii TaxID=28172 RepID=UPI00165E0AB1|nr:GPO family capsid scaffolding protein [Vibrio metschnikovii]